MKKQAYTVTESLITVAILGIVAVCGVSLTAGWIKSKQDSNITITGPGCPWNVVCSNEDSKYQKCSDFKGQFDLDHEYYAITQLDNGVKVGNMITYVYSYKNDENKNMTYLSGSDQQGGIFVIPVGSTFGDYKNDAEQGLKFVGAVPSVVANNTSAKKYICDDEASQGCGLVAVYEHSFFCNRPMTLADNAPKSPVLPLEDTANSNDQQQDQDQN